MRTPRFSPFSPLALALFWASTLLLGCAVERSAINRVQPDYLDKDQIIPLQYALLTSGAVPGSLTPALAAREPQWYHQITIIDKPATAGGGGVSSYTQVDRITWEVTENTLFARLAYEQLRDSQDTTRRPPVSNNPRQGEILAAYAITAHFDIRRDYNATTGEDLNVVLENITDRPWYQRRFIRVNWSRNLVGAFNPLNNALASGRLRAEPVSAWYNDPDDPNRPVFDYGTFNGVANRLRYFDLTNRMILHVEEAQIPGLTGIPVCYLYDRITDSCQPADVLMRVAFRRVDPARDYQPQVLDGRRMERFGFFEDTRNGFSDHLGAPGQLERRHFANRHNLWMQHHAQPANNALDHKPGDPGCRVDTDCFGLSATARCDLTRAPTDPASLGITASRRPPGTCGEVYIRCAPSTRSDDLEALQRDADTQCASVGSGASCDLDIATTRTDRLGLCLLPYRQRTVRPIAYHLSQNYPERIMPVTRQIATEWNRVFTDAVRQARYRECLLDPRGGGPSECESWRSASHERTRDARFVWVQCHNPVWGTNPALPGAHTAAEVLAEHDRGWDIPSACGVQGTSARLGDIRYSMLASINEYDAQGPWGLAGITGDPVTGEVLSGRGSVWLTVTDAQSAWATDLMRILNHDVDPSRFALGQTVRDAYDYVRALGAREEHAAQPRMAGQPRPVLRDFNSQTELQNILQANRFDHLVTVSPETLQLRPEQLREMSRDTDGSYNGRALTRNLTSILREVLPHSQGSDTSDSRRAALRGSGFEASLIDREMQLAGGLDPERASSGAPVPPDVMERVSPFRQNNMAFREHANRLRDAMQEHECRYEASEAFNDDVVAVMLNRFRRNEVPEDVRFGQNWNFHTGSAGPCPEEAGTVTEGGVTRGDCPLNYEVVQNYLTQYIHYGVTLHEIGHSIGERHNFSGSADAINYFDRYWQLRRTAANAGVNDPPVPADQIRGRWEHQARGLPFYSAQEQREGVEEYGYSSVMEYKGWNEDAHGLGRYDRAFVLHGYVNMVESFDRVANPAEALVMFEGTTGGYQSAFRLNFIGSPTAPTVKTYHYTDIPRLVGVTADGSADIGDDNRYPVFLSETQRRGYGAFNWTADHTNVTTGGRDGTRGTEHVLVPYSFGTDNWANYVWNTQRYDAGADMYESMRYVARHFLDYYFSNAFARGRANFTVSGYRGRITSRYLDQAYYSMRNFVYLNAIYRNAYAGLLAQAENFSTQPTMVAGTLGSNTVADMMANIILMPQTSASSTNGSQHGLHQRTDGSVMFDRGYNGTTVNVPIGQGREFSTYYDFGSGFFWRERITNVGAYHEKQLALEYMTDTFNWVPGRTVIEFNDVHNLQINFYTLYPGQTLRFFGSLLSRDHSDIAVQVQPTTPGEGDFLRTQFTLLNLPAGTGPGQSGRSTALNAIDPNLGFTLELEAMGYLFTQLELTFDRNARQSARLWREGDLWGLPPSEVRSFVNFRNPFTGVLYSALHVGGRDGEPGNLSGLSRRDASANETGIAARMLLEAQRLGRAFQSAPAPNRPQIQRELQGYIDVLERMRDMSRMFN